MQLAGRTRINVYRLDIASTDTPEYDANWTGPWRQLRPTQEAHLLRLTAPVAEYDAKMPGPPTGPAVTI